MATYTIPQKTSGTGSIHDIASDMCDRDIKFAKGCSFAVMLSSYYGGKGYTTHKTEGAAIRASHANNDYSHVIIDASGNRYEVDYDRLVRTSI